MPREFRVSPRRGQTFRLTRPGFKLTVFAGATLHMIIGDMRGGGRPFRGRGRGGGGHRGSHRGGSHRGHRGHGGFRGHRGGGGRGSFAAGRHQNSKNALVVGPRLSEIDVGITEFISKHDGFSAVVKHRFSDFQVNEIDSEGNVVKLTLLDVPAENEDDVKAERHELIPEDIWEKLSNIVKKPAAENPGKADTSNVTTGSQSGVGDTTCPQNESESSNNDSEKSISPAVISSSALALPTENEAQSVELEVTSLDKDSRRAIHNCVKKAFKDLNSNTTERDGKKFVVFGLAKSNRDRQNRGKWPECRSGEYLYFVVHKRNMDTTETVNLISRKLGMRPNNITFAGTKDKRGITSQLMCIKRGEPSRMYHLSKGIYNVYLGNYSFKTKPLRLGDLKGNQFRIALRNVEGSDEQINAGLESLKNNGFINYYGLQRFGTNKNVPTHLIGKALLQSDWAKAVDLILEPREGFVHIKAALDEWKSSRNAKEALQKLERPTNCLEELLLKGLDRHGSNDFVNALSMIPLNTQLMYVHAYQSLIWNKTVSKRVSEFGLEPVVGDLVLVKSEKLSGLDNTIDEDTEITEGPALEDAAEVLVEEKNMKQDVRYITEDDIGNYKIDDVVLPLPGHDVLFPNNSIGTFMKDLLKEDNLSPESLNHPVKRFAVRGTYRRIVSRAEQLSWKIVRYNDPESDFILTDFDIFKGKDEPKDVEDGKYKAIVFSMCLELSTYATMALREITKTDTSAATQASMSAAAAASHKDEDAVKVKQEKVDTASEDGNGNLSEAASNENVKTEPNDAEQDVALGDLVKEERVDLSAADNAIKNEPNENVSAAKRKAEELPDVISEKRVKEDS